MFEIFFNESLIIRGPSFHVDLAALDALHPIYYSRRLLIFQCTSTAQRNAQVASLKAGLQALLSVCPILGGKIAPLPSDAARNGYEDWRTIVPDRGIELILRDLQTAVPSFSELKRDHFSPIHFPFDLLMPVPQDLDKNHPFAACKVQFSAIQGGTVLTFAMSHSVADGNGMDEWMRVMIEKIRLSQEGSTECIHDMVRNAAGATRLGEDRSILRQMKSDVAFNVDDHPAYRSKETSTSGEQTFSHATPHPFEATSAEKPILFRFSAHELAQLKSDATTPGKPSISTHDALCALMWRTVLLVRSRRASSSKIPSTTITNLFMPSDARRHLNLPPSYIGNAVYQLNAEMELDTLLSPSGLQKAASTVRQAISAATPDLVSSYMAFINDPKCSSSIEWQFLSTYSTTGFAMGTCLGSGVILYGGDWGEAFGPVVSFRLVNEAFNCIMPRLPDGGAEVVVSVMPSEVELVKSFDGFGKYINSTE